MNALRERARDELARLSRVFSAVRDSPLAELDLRELFASWRTGLLLGFLTLAIGGAAIAAAVVSSEAPFRAYVAKVGVGPYLVGAAQLAIALALTIIIPIRAAGVVEGPRWRGFFDQLVTSGMRPWQYYLGRAFGTQGMIALVFLGTAPLVLALALTDPPPLRPVLTNHALLLVYAELLLVATLGIGALVNESAAALGTMVLAAAISGLAFAPVPSALVALTPVRAITASLVALGNDNLTPGECDVVFGPAHVFGYELSLASYEVLASLVLGALALSCCFVGRPFVFGPGLNNFGAIVLEGDRRRAAILRFRPTLVRRGEVAFFFENHGPWHERLAPWFRLGRAAALFLVVTVVPLGAFWNEAFLGIVKARDHIGVGFSLVAGIFGVGAFLGPLFFASSKLDARVDVALGRARLPMVLADLALYTVLLVGLLRLFDATTDDLLAAKALTFVPTFGIPWKTATDMAEGFDAVARIAIVTGLAVFLLQKIVGLRLNDAIGGVVAAWLLVGATAFLPVAVDPREMKRSEAKARDPDQEEAERSPEQNAYSLVALHLCPAFQVRLVFEPTLLEDVPLPAGKTWPWLAQNGFWALYPALEGLLLVAVIQIVRRRRAAVAAELAAPLEKSEPAPSEPGKAPTT